MTTRVGLVGCGRWGRHILRDLVALGARVEVATLGATQEEARRLGATAVHDSLAALPPQDGYLVAVPTTVHAAVVETLLPRGRPVFCEKPLTPDATTTRRLAALGGGRLFVMHKWRYHPGVERLAALLASGELGRPLALQVRQMGWGHAHGDVDAATILLPHALSIVLHLLGDVPPLQQAWATVPGRADAGVVARLGRAGGPAVLLEYGVAQPDHRRSVLLVGSRATAQLAGSYDEALLLRHGAPGDAAAAEERRPLPGALPLEREVAAFLAHLRGGPPPLSPVADELVIAERLEEIRQEALAP